MIFRRPPDSEEIDQGDILDDCPLLWSAFWDLDRQPAIVVDVVSRRVIVLTQSCDLANQKAKLVNLAVVRDAASTVPNELKPADIKGPVRALRVWGYYFLPADDALGLPEMIVDLRQLHTVPIDMLKALVARGKRRGRLQPLYREHLNKFFGDTYSRIGLPKPYATV